MRERWEAAIPAVSVIFNDRGTREEIVKKDSERETVIKEFKVLRILQ